AATDVVRLTRSEVLNTTITVAGIEFAADGITISGTGSITVVNGANPVTVALTGPSPATATIAVPLTLNAPSGQDDLVQVDALDTLNLTNTVTTLAGATLRKRGLGTLNLAGSNTTLASSVTVAEGSLGVANNNALNTGAIAVTVNAGASIDVSG